MVISPVGRGVPDGVVLSLPLRRGRHLCAGDYSYVSRPNHLDHFLSVFTSALGLSPPQEVFGGSPRSHVVGLSPEILV